MKRAAGSVWITAAVVVFVQTSWAPLARAATARSVCEASVPSSAGDLNISAGRDEDRAWVTGHRGELRVQKFTSHAGGAVIELKYRNDAVVIQVAESFVRVTRDGTSIVVDSPESFGTLQQLLGGSAAMFHARMLLSDFEGRSTLRAPEMSLLSGVAFATSLTGDAGAPLRLTDRFMQRHRGVYRQARYEEESCWTSYSGEVNAAWGDLQDCMSEADGSGWLAPVRRMACNGTWLLRGESAWFEYLKCLSPLAAISKLD